MYFNSVTYFHLFISFHPLVLCAYNLKSTFKMGYMLLLHKHKCEQMMVHIEYWTVITEAGIQNIICWRSSLIKEYLIWRKVTSVCHICQVFTKVIHICEIAISIWTDSIWGSVQHPDTLAIFYCESSFLSLCRKAYLNKNIIMRLR